MQCCARALPLLLAAAWLTGRSAAAPWAVTKEIRTCVIQTLDKSLAANFSGGECPPECADTFTEPVESIFVCANKAAACGCSKVVPLAVGAVKVCCEPLWEFLQPACGRALDGLANTMERQIARMCEDISGAIEGEASSHLLEAGSLRHKTRAAFIEGATAVVTGLHASGQQYASASAGLFQQAAGGNDLKLEEHADEAAEASRKFVNSQAQGAACMEMVEAFENEHGAVTDDEVPDLKAAAKAIVRSSFALLGFGSPTLEAKVHRAMVAAWTEDGPGLGAEGICEVLFRHRDDL